MANQNQQRDSFTASTSGEHCPGPEPILYKRSGSQKRQRDKSWKIALTEEEEGRAIENARSAGLWVFPNKRHFCFIGMKG